jgi:hypothetical protein
MSKHLKEQHQPQPKIQTSPAEEEAKKLKQAAEVQEVAGRHKNDGQKGHKGAR